MRTDHQPSFIILKDTEKRYSELGKRSASYHGNDFEFTVKTTEKDGLVSRKIQGKRPPIKYKLHHQIDPVLSYIAPLISLFYYFD